MPEYLAPGVYVEETSFRSKSIEGVSTSTAAFVGATRYGPTRGVPELVTSFSEFERIYGSLDQLEHPAGTKVHNYLAHGVRAFFAEGGSRLYVSRVYLEQAGDTKGGRAAYTFGTTKTVDFKGRYPGAAGNLRISLTVKLSRNVLSQEPVDPNNASGTKYPVLRGVANYDLVFVTSKDTTGGLPGTVGDLFWVDRYFDGQRHTFRLRKDSPVSEPSSPLALTAINVAAEEAKVYVVTVTVALGTIGKSGKVTAEHAWPDLSFHPDHPQSLSKVFDAAPTDRATALYVPITVETTEKNPVDIAAAVLSAKSLTATDSTTLLGVLQSATKGVTASEADLTARVMMTGGNDGERPKAAAYEGTDGEGETGADKGKKSGLLVLEDVEDVSIVAAPGVTAGYSDSMWKIESDQIVRGLIGHAERMRYRIAVLDSAENHLVSDVREYRAQLDSSHAALYFPWVRTLDPVTGEMVNLPPSGFVAGIYARNDVENGVHKAPANEVVRLAQGFSLPINKAQQDVLNPEGINCFRSFEGRGHRLWGARTLSSDPEWKYVNVRRYFAYLERSIEKGTQWVVFMNNGDPLWNNVRRTMEDFLFNEWKSERLLGTKPEEAYFVRCDRSTMTQNDLDNGRMIALVGVSPVRPAEFVIFRIGQWTAERNG